jgi:antitoxin component YwqK of YwqJK toxin-antitoxin module
MEEAFMVWLALLRNKINFLMASLLVVWACHSAADKSGCSITYWENGKMRMLANYKEGVYHGRVYEWDAQGKIYRIGTYANGQEEGLQRLYYANGKIRANYEVIEGRKYGLAGTKNCRNVGDSIH